VIGFNGNLWPEVDLVLICEHFLAETLEGKQKGYLQECKGPMYQRNHEQFILISCAVWARTERWFMKMP
jgi:hypothetical protein